MKLCGWRDAGGSAHEALTTRVGVVLRELGEHGLEHLALVVADLLGVEEACVVDQSTVELVELAEELELVRTDADELHEDRQLGHLRQVLADLALGTPVRLAVGDEERVRRVLGLGLDLEGRSLPEEATTAGAEVDLAEAGGVHDPLQRGHVVGAAHAAAADGLVDEALAVAEGDLADVGHAAVEERERHGAVVVEDETGGEAEVGRALHGAVLVEAGRGAAEVERADDGRLVALRVEALLLQDHARLLDEADQMRSLLLNLLERNAHGIHFQSVEVHQRLLTGAIIFIKTYKVNIWLY